MSKNYTDDTALLEGLKKRNPRAYEFLYNTSKVRLTILAASILKNEEAAKDLVQEFFTDFWDKRLYENINISLKAYLYYTVRNRSFRFIKTGRRYDLLIDDLSHDPELLTPHYFENEELKVQLENAIGKLSPMAGKVFRMHYIDELSHQQISEMLGISKQTVGNHIHKALTDLREDLKKTYK